MPDLFEEKEKEKPADQTEIIALVKDYVNTRIELTKLKLTERVSCIAANFITDAFVAVMLLLVFLFGSITLGLFLGELVGSYAGGFGIVTLIYLTLALIAHFAKDRLVDNFLINFIIKRITQKKQ